MRNEVRGGVLYLTPDGEPVPDATIAMSDQVTTEDKWIAEKVQ